MRVPVRNTLAARLRDRRDKHTRSRRSLRVHAFCAQSAWAARMGIVCREKSPRLLIAGYRAFSHLFDDHGASLVALATTAYVSKRGPCLEFSLGTARVPRLARPGELQVCLSFTDSGTRHDLLHTAVISGCEGHAMNSRLSNSIPIILAASIFLPNSCEPHAAESQRRLKLVFITCCVDEPFFGPVKKGMHDAAKRMDVDCDFIGTKGVDPVEQAKMVRQAVADGYNGIALNLIDTKAFDSVVADAISKRVPVVGFNIDDNSTPNARLASVNQRVHAAGRILAQHALSDIPPGAHILMTKHDDGVSALEDRLLGAQEVLKPKNITWTTIVTGNDAESAAKLVAKALRENTDIRIILSSGQSDTE